MYTLIFSNRAKEDLEILSKKAPNAIPKLKKLLEELRVHPQSGTGQVEQLKGYDGTVFSRRLTKEHRLVYRILHERIEVLIISAYGHYK